MNKEESIKILSEIKESSQLLTSVPMNNTTDVEALDMAIEALSVPEGEYINKAELIKRMLGHINRFTKEKNFSMNEGLKYAQGVICGMPTFAVPEREKGEWIPVSKKLPDEEREVYCQLSDGSNAVLYVQDNWGQMEWVDGLMGTGTYDVVAWREKPESYKSEKVRNKNE